MRSPPEDRKGAGGPAGPAGANPEAESRRLTASAAASGEREEPGRSSVWRAAEKKIRADTIFFLHSLKNTL
jgi:hypothetical protein